MSDRALAILLLATVSLGGCVEERVVSARGGLYGMPGASGGYRVEDDAVSVGTSVEQILRAYHPADPSLTPIENEPLRYRDATGELVIVSRSGQHVIYHISEMLARGEDDLLFDWIISDRAKLAYRESFLDPHETVAWLRENEEDVIALFRLMPAGEGSSGVRLTAPEQGVLRLTPELDRRYTKTRFNTLELVIEDGSCKLLTIY